MRVIQILMFIGMLLGISEMASVSKSASMKCGECLYYGYNSCTKDIDHRIVNSSFSTLLGFEYDPSDTNYNICYGQNEISKYSDDQYICTNTYNNSLYATYACPQLESVCGKNGSYGPIELINVNDTGSINITGMTMGDTCFYPVKTSCGFLETSINHTVTSQSTLASPRDNLNIDIIEF